jgi:D-alanine-D-alanine ligase
VQRVADTGDEALLRSSLEKAWHYDDVLLCERFVRGREITCGIVDVQALGGLRALPVTEIFSHAADWYDFRSRYAAGGSSHVCPADIPVSVAEHIQDVAKRAHRALGCRDLSRVDFVVGDGLDEKAVTLLEVNVIPGMTATSLYPEAAAAGGISFESLCDGLVRQAVDRATQRVDLEALPMP